MSLTTVRLVAAVPPKVTRLAPVRFVPVMVTFVMPVIGPNDGTTPVMVALAALTPGITTAVIRRTNERVRRNERCFPDFMDVYSIIQNIKTFCIIIFFEIQLNSKKNYFFKK
jgi:archaellum biogenesis protein FlaJ (TadC family)